jgi:predicted nucleic acid-binding Zn finger protein
MKPQKELNIIDKAYKEIKDNGNVIATHFKQLSEVFGDRFTKALDAVEGGRVKKYIFSPSGRIVWIVVGKEKEYQIIPIAGFCSCDDFYFRVMDREAKICYHLIAQKIAEMLEKYDKIEEEDRLYNCLMEEWKRVTA